MSTKRGATLSEVLIAMGMIVVLMLGATSLYGYCLNRVMAETTRTTVVSQASQLADEIAAVIGNSKSCSLVTSGSITALRCTMPDSGVDKNGDNIIDRVEPTSVNSSGTETFGTGRYVWFYQSDATGAWGATGKHVWRAKPLTSANPVGGDLDGAWSLYYGGVSRWKFIDSIAFTVDTTNHCTTFTINASSLNRSESSASSETSTSNNTKVTVSRTVFWRSYR